MKELTIEEKAKLYDKALEKARQLCAYPTTKLFISDLQDLFSELIKESGDEKIRNTLIDYFKDYKTQEEVGIKTFFGIPTDNILAWLKKQALVKHFELKTGHWYMCHRAYCCRADHLTVQEGERFQCEKDGVVKGFVIKDPEKYFIEVHAPASIEDNQNDEVRRRSTIQVLEYARSLDTYNQYGKADIDKNIAWLEKQGKQKPTLPKWKYKNDNTPLLRDSLILNKYGCVAKSPSGAFVNDVWVIDYDELAKLPKEELEKQGEQETLCDKCRKEHPSHSCQDITELGRCAVEHEQETDNSYCQENCKGFQETGRCFCDGECKAKKEYIEQNLQENNFPQIEQKPAWSKEDDYNVQCLIAKVTYDIQKGNVGRNYKLIDWLKSLKYRMNNV